MNSCRTVCWWCSPEHPFPQVTRFWNLEKMCGHTWLPKTKCNGKIRFHNGSGKLYLPIQVHIPIWSIFRTAITNYITQKEHFFQLGDMELFLLGFNGKYFHSSSWLQERKKKWKKKKKREKKVGLQRLLQGISCYNNFPRSFSSPKSNWSSLM